MKTFNLKLQVTLLAIVLGFALSACSGDKDEGDFIKLTKGAIGDIDGVYLDAANNLCAYDNPETSDYSSFSSVSIVSVGKVNGLSDIETIPTSGWNKSVPAIRNSGYIVKKVTYVWAATSPWTMGWRYATSYARIYVADYIQDVSGIIGVNVKYEPNWTDNSGK